jgi:hypothetical protein
VHKQEFTAWCQQSDGRGTIWISTVEIEQAEDITSDEDIESAKLAAREACAADWGADDCSDIHCLGLAKGDVQIVSWNDLGDD